MPSLTSSAIITFGLCTYNTKREHILIVLNNLMSRTASIIYYYNAQQSVVSGLNWKLGVLQMQGDVPGQNDANFFFFLVLTEE